MSNPSNREKFNEADRILSDLAPLSGSMNDEELKTLGVLVNQKIAIQSAGVERVQEARVEQLRLAVRTLRDKTKGLLGK